MSSVETKYYNEEGKCLTSVDPLQIFNTVWVQKCMTKANLSLPDVAFKLGILSTLGGELFHYRQVVYLNEHGDFNFKLSPMDQQRNERLATQELELLGYVTSFEDINNMVEEWLDENFPIQVKSS